MARRIIWSVTAVLCVLAIYAASYYALVYRGTVYYGPDVRPVVVTWPATYAIRGDWVESLFWPMNQVDRLIRPNYWVTPPRDLNR
jgi:hypothetical protein